VADAHFEHPRLALAYDPLDPDRRDLAAYAALAAELGARSVLDIGCGTGIFACLLARRGFAVTAADPAAASLAVARAKPGADLVRWVQGEAAALPPLAVDLATMTGNVAQVFLTDAEWASVLSSARSAVRPGWHLVFETRDPRQQAWREWDREHSSARADLPGGVAVESWPEVTQVRGALVSFRTTFAFSDGETLYSDSTLRFREREEITGALQAAGFTVAEVREAPDRPGREFVFIARRA
jgi:SAM-dependent methyltransferase